MDWRWLTQPTSAGESRLRKLRLAGGITDKDTDPWARCRGKGGGAAARGKGVTLRNCVRRIQRDKMIAESCVTEVKHTHIYIVQIPDTCLREESLQPPEREALYISTYHI